ncbi:unnamed protein product [Durusdinium trenchii]|uniref:Uncharacterized protein n=1 Tax=Durusdinium trenchii TaxID=1381693 RepID=A0ABP0QQS8_9DINO
MSDCISEICMYTYRYTLQLIDIICGQDVDGGMLESQFAGEDANAAFPESAEDRVKQAAVVAAAGKSKLVFPTIQRNDSPFAVLPTFINVLCKKVDSATDAKDRLIAMKIPRATEMAKEMEKLLTSLNSLYGKLSAKQADYLAMDTSKPESLEAKKNEVMGLFAQCTKDDVTLNNYLTRSKNIKKPTESVAAKKSLKRNPPSGEVAKAKKAKK